MSLLVHTDPAQIAVALREDVAADPIGYTVAGSICAEIETHAEQGAWFACPAPEPVLSSMDLPGRRPIAARSSDHTPLLVLGDWSAHSLVALLEVALQLPNLQVITGAIPSVEAFATYASEHLAVAAERTPMRLFRLDSLTPPQTTGSPRLADEYDADLVCDWYLEFFDEIGAPPHRDGQEWARRKIAARAVWLWVDGERPVSMAGSTPPVFGSTRIGPVYTPDAYRGHGYGSAVTAQVSREVLRTGNVPVLFTDLANPTSNGIYQRMGYRRVHDTLEIQFTEPLSNTCRPR